MYEQELAEAIVKNDRTKVEQLLNQGASIDNYHYFSDKVEAYCTPLHLAAFHNRPEILQLLIKKGANVNLLTKEPYTKQWAVKMATFGFWNNCANYTALHLAGLSQNTQCAKILLENGADYQIRGKGGKIPNLNVVTEALESCNNVTRFHLSNYKLENAELTAIGYLLQNNKSIKKLDLPGCLKTTDQFTYLLLFLRKTQITEFNMDLWINYWDFLSSPWVNYKFEPYEVITALSDLLKTNKYITAFNLGTLYAVEDRTYRETTEYRANPYTGRTELVQRVAPVTYTIPECKELLKINSSSILQFGEYEIATLDRLKHGQLEWSYTLSIEKIAELKQALRDIKISLQNNMRHGYSESSEDEYTSESSDEIVSNGMSRR